MYEMTLAEKVDFNMLQVKCLPYAVVMLNLTIIVVLSVIKHLVLLKKNR